MRNFLNFLAAASSAILLGSVGYAEELPAGFNKYKIETEVMSKFVSLQEEKSDYFIIKNIERSDFIDTYYNKPAYKVTIFYSTQTCENNYFQGTAFSAFCYENECPFKKVFKNCY